MNELLTESVTDLIEQTPEAAMELHCKIITAGVNAANNLIEMCKGLKTMRDQNLYKQLGHSTFDDYCTDRAGIKSRQAYNYIKMYEDLPEQFLQLNAHLGVTKLELLAHLPTYDLESFSEENDIADISVVELKRLLEEEKKKTAQLEFSLEEATRPAEVIDNLEVSECEPVITESDLELARKEGAKEAEEKAKEKAKADKEKLLAKLTKEAEERAEAKLEEVKANADKEAQKKYEAALSSLAKEKAQAGERAIELEKQLKLADSTTAKFKIHFDSIQASYQNLLSVMSECQNQETRDKLIAATKALIKNMEERADEQ